MLSKEGFVFRVSSIQHETNMYNAYKSPLSLQSIENSKEILLQNFIKQQEKIERYEKALRFYADKENYEVTSNDLDPTTDYVHIVDIDEGDTARKVLSE
jgi:hypothetical protein